MARSMHVDDKPVYRVIIRTTGHTPDGVPVGGVRAIGPYSSASTARAALTKEKNHWDRVKETARSGEYNTRYNSTNGIHDKTFVEREFVLQKTSGSWADV